MLRGSAATALCRRGACGTTSPHRRCGGGFDPTPFSIVHGDGDSVNVQALDAATGAAVAADIQVFEGDSIAIKATGVERYPGVVATGAKVAAILEALSVEVVTVDVGDNLISVGRVQVTGGFQTNGFEPTPL